MKGGFQNDSTNTKASSNQIHGGGSGVGIDCGSVRDSGGDCGDDRFSRTVDNRLNHLNRLETAAELLGIVLEFLCPLKSSGENLRGRKLNAMRNRAAALIYVLRPEWISESGSGAEVSRRLGISREAFRKHCDSLKTNLIDV